VHVIADVGSLSAALDQFLKVFKLGQAGVQASAWNLLTTLAAIELILAALGWAITGQDALVGLIKKILLIGFFVFVIQHYDSLLHIVIEGFIQTGKTASSSGGDVLASIRDPSTIIDAGFYVALPVLEHLKSFGGLDAIYHLQDVLICLLCALGIIAAYFIMAIQVFVTYLEFAIISTLGLILVPFGTLRHTRFLAEKVFGAVIAFGIKLMVLGLLISVTLPVLKQFALPEDPTWTQLFSLLAICFAVAALAWHAPGVAAGILSGGPSLTAATAAGTSVAAVSGGIGAAMLGNTAARSAASGAVGLGAQATKKAASALGAASAGMQMSLAEGNAKGRSPLQRSARALGAAAGAVGGAALRSLTQPAAHFRDELRSTFESNQAQVPGFSKLKAQKAAEAAKAASALRASDASTISSSAEPAQSLAASPPLTQNKTAKAAAARHLASASAAEEGSPAPSSHPKGRQVKSALKLAKQAVPPTASPAGGLSAPIKPDGDESL
jgi:type IV secretion system protein TrbL